MKITFFLTEIGKSGGPLIHYNFMNGLLDLGHEVYLVTMYQSLKWKKDLYKKYINITASREEEKRGRIIDSLQKLSGQYNKSVIMSMTPLLLRNYERLNIDGDVFIASHPYTGDVVYKLGRFKKIVMYNMHFEELMFESQFDRNEISAINYLPFNHIALSTWLQKMFEYNYGLKPTVINPGIDNSIFYPPPSLEKFTRDKRLKIVSYCDPARKFKGYPQQMRILETLANDPSIEIILFGNDPKVTSFHYSYLGWLDQRQLADVYRQSQILLMPSWYESFPLPPIEAMACGCAVAACQFGTEDYLIDGKTGIVINPFNLTQSVKKIKNLANQPLFMKKIASEGIKVSKKFDWHKQSLLLEAFLKNIDREPNLDITAIQNGNLRKLDKIYA